MRPHCERCRDTFKRGCAAKGVNYDEQALEQLLKEWYISKNRALRAVHPRDLINQLLDIATYLNKPPVLSKDMIDRSAASYFVNLD